MEKKYFYFQPEYVNKFKCDGSKCDAHCCRKDWNISIDKETYDLYAQLDTQEVIKHIKTNSDGGYFIDFGEKNFCPFLTENKLCRLQLEHGEKFLSGTCATYPRITSNFGYFFERSLILSCPVAAEMILFEREPMKFEFVQVPKKIHSLDGKIFAQKIQAAEEIKEHVIEIQVAMISILQERTLTIDQRLIVLGFFVDRLGEILANFNKDALTKLIAAYESKKFLAEQVPLMIQSVKFDEKKFIKLMPNFLEKVFGGDVLVQSKDFSITVKEALPLVNDKKIFSTEHSSLFENFLVNELFLDIFPWKFDGSIAQNYAAFVTEYKFFELIIFSVARKGFNAKKDFIEVAGWFATRFGHTKGYKRNIFSFVENIDEPFLIMESLLEGSD